MIVTAGSVLLATLVIIMGCLYEYFCGVQEQQLKDELSLAAAAMQQGEGETYLQSLNSDRYRLTWVAADGTVLYDTRTDAETMENHAQRQEIQQALLAGQGESSRYSSTLLEKTLYQAQRLEDGSVLRISISRATAGVLVLGMLQPLLVVLAVALILSALLARRVARHIVKPLNELDLEHPLDNDTYEELSPLLGRINQQRRQIDAQLRELQRKRDEFDQVTGSMQEGLVLLNERGEILSINPAAQTLFRADGSCVGQDFLTIERSGEVSRALHAALAGGHSEIHTERDGREYQLDISRIQSDGAVTGAVVDIPIFMPLVGMDKKDIISIAREIGTLDTSILPYEDCCTVFTPKHPKTKPTLGQVVNAEKKLDREALIARALENVEKIKVTYHDEPLL